MNTIDKQQQDAFPFGKALPKVNADESIIKGLHDAFGEDSFRRTSIRQDTKIDADKAVDLINDMLTHNRPVVNYYIHAGGVGVWKLRKEPPVPTVEKPPAPVVEDIHQPAHDPREEGIVNQKPTAPKTIFENIPEQLTQRPQWVNWRYELSEPDNKGQRRWTKVPYQPNGRNAKTDQRETWHPFATVVDAFHKRNFDGIGFVFTPNDSFVGIDWDNILDENQAIKPWAKPILEQIESYSEISPSGKGVKTFLMGDWGKGQRKAVSDGEIEVYDYGRYFTVTGLQISTDKRIKKEQDILDQIRAQFFPKDPKPTGIRNTPSNNFTPSEAEVMRLIRNASNFGKFNRLFHGDTSMDNSHSEADASLCAIIAFYSQDPAVIDSIFRQSALIRDKWDDRHSADGRTYGQMTIDFVLSKLTKVYTPQKTRYNHRRRQALRRRIYGG